MGEKERVGQGEFLFAVQRLVAQVSIGPSTLRNTRASGVIVAAREALARADLTRFGEVSSAADFRHELNRVTQQIRRNLPAPADQWGNARKALNVFLRNAFYTKYLARELHHRNLERWLELPLDSFTAKALRKQDAGAALPPWPGVAALDWRTSAAYQAAAQKVANEWGVARVHLDLFWWRQP